MTTPWIRPAVSAAHVAAMIVLAVLASACTLSPQQIFERSAPSVVRIEARRFDGDVIGTGFAISDRYIATNLHVIDVATDAFVQLENGSRFSVRRVVAFDERQDLAIIETSATNLRPLRFGDSSKLAQGERIYAIGNPLGLDYTITEGLFSGMRRLRASGDVELLQVSAELSQGSSGGPLLNQRGEVVGVASRVFAQGNYGLGIPIRALIQLRDNVRAPQRFEEFSQSRIRLFEDYVQRRGGGRQRAIPQHPDAFLASCARVEVEDVYAGINGAISRGAPIYNEGDHEACFRIYEGAALKLIRDLSDACSAGKLALEDGLERAEALASPDDKAWAMRDAFDGLLLAIARRFPDLGGR